VSKHPDDQISAKYRREMNTLAAVLDEHFNAGARPKKVCFVLLVTEFDNMAGRVNYIANGNRKDIIVMMKEILARFEGQPEQKGQA
jgi:hypothetical protein